MVGKVSYKRSMALILSVLLSPAAVADSWVMSIPYAVSDEQVYKVRIERIDGISVTKALRYRVAAGEHTVTVSPLVDIEWSPDLAENPSENPRTKNLRLVVRQGKTYQLAVKVNTRASVESQMDQSYWSPYVYAIIED